MDLFEINVDEIHFNIFAQSFLGLEEDNICGIIESKGCAWIAKGNIIYIVSLKNGQILSIFDLSKLGSYDTLKILTVDYLCLKQNEVLLAAVLRISETPGNSLIALMSLKKCSLVNCIEITAEVSSILFLQEAECRRSLLQYYNGCLALGCEDGEVLLLDLKLQGSPTFNSRSSIVAPSVTYNFDIPLPLVRKNLIKCQQNGKHIVLRMQNVDNPCRVTSLHSIHLILGLCIGYDDGRLAIFDLLELHLLCIVQPVHGRIPLVKITSIEPRDDPRPCIYFWAIHQNDSKLTTVLHSIMYENRLEDCTGFQTLENFQLCSIRHQLLVENGPVSVLSCQTLYNENGLDEDNTTCLCALSWFSFSNRQNKILCFDINQWYKNEMPLQPNHRENPSYLAIFSLKGDQRGFKLSIKSDTIAHYTPLERCEEHFYPNSISFDCVVLVANGIRSYNWEGVQNKLVNIIRFRNSEILYEPDSYFRQIIQMGLVPMFIDVTEDAIYSKKYKQEVLLSFAIENNCQEILRDCSKCFFESNLPENSGNSAGIHLSFLIEWSWKRASLIRERCNYLSQGLLNLHGYILDVREQKELRFLTRQLKLIVKFLRNLNEELRCPNKDILSKHKTLELATNYYEMLLWMFTNGLLPETLFKSKCVKSNPFSTLQLWYCEKRTYFFKINHHLVSKKNVCTLLFIDKFIDRECSSIILQELWNKNDSDGIYPPASLEFLLKIMLLPDLSFQTKCSILMYFYLDLQLIMKDGDCQMFYNRLTNFLNVFKLQMSFMKTIQCFWNLDHGNFLAAVDMFMSPNRTSVCDFPHWYTELFIESLLTQNSPKLALRVLNVCSSISPILTTKTMLLNNLLNEAFYFARGKTDNYSLLNLFFRWCLCSGKYAVLCELVLSDRENNILQNVIQQSNIDASETLQVAHLLQRSKYVEAISYMNSLSKPNACSMDTYMLISEANSGSNLLLSALNFTMNPITQSLTDVYFRIKNKLKKKENTDYISKPFSCHLIKKNSNNFSGEIYHSSVLCSNFASTYWGHESLFKNSNNNLLPLQNTPFLSKPQCTKNYVENPHKEEISYPVVYKVCEKRSLSNHDLSNFCENIENIDTEILNPKKRRRYFYVENVENDKIGNKLLDVSVLNSNEHELANDSSITKELLALEENTTISIKPSYAKELQGILKTKLKEDQESFKSCFEEDKSLRFTLSTAESDIIQTNPAINSQTVCGAVDTQYYSLSDVNMSKKCSPSSKSIFQFEEKQFASHICSTDVLLSDRKINQNDVQNYNGSATPFATSTTYEGLENICLEESKNSSATESNQIHHFMSTSQIEHKTSSINNDGNANFATLKKINEFSTVVGTIPDIELNGESFKLFEICKKPLEIKSGIKQTKCIDTTLGMTSYELTETEIHCSSADKPNLNNSSLNTNSRIPCKTAHHAEADVISCTKYESKLKEIKDKVLEESEIASNVNEDVKNCDYDFEEQSYKPTNTSLMQNEDSIIKNKIETKTGNISHEVKSIQSINAPSSNGNEIPIKKTRRRSYSSIEHETNVVTDKKPRIRKSRGVSEPLDKCEFNKQSEKDVGNESKRSYGTTNEQNIDTEIFLISDPEKKEKRLRGISEPPESTEMPKRGTQNMRGKSLPPTSRIEKKQTHTLLEPITENSVLDSPSSRTRSRLRFNSCGVEINTSLNSSGSSKKKVKQRKTSDNYKSKENVNGPESNLNNMSEFRTHSSKLAGESDDSDESSQSQRRITRSTLKKTVEKEELSKGK